MLTDDSSAVADVSPTVGVLQPTLLRETLLELNQLEARQQHHITEEKHLAAELRVRDDEVIERQRTIDELRAERFSLQEQLAQYRQKSNQMSTALHSNTQTTPTTSVVYTSNKITQCIRLYDNSFGNTRSLVENSVTPIDLRLSYNVKLDIYDNQLLCLIVRLLCLSI